MTLAIPSTLISVQDTSLEASPVKAAASTVDNLSLVAALSCLMSAVYFLATSLVG